MLAFKPGRVALSVSGGCDDYDGGDSICGSIHLQLLVECTNASSSKANFYSLFREKEKEKQSESEKERIVSA